MMMAKRKTGADDTAEPQREPAPPFFIATQPIYAPGGETLPARAYNPGDRVLPEAVRQHGWADLVEAPEGDWTPPEPLPPDTIAEIQAAPAGSEASDQAGSPPGGNGSD